MASDAKQALRYALADAWDIGHGGGSYPGGCATARGITGDPATGYHEAEVYLLEAGVKRAPRVWELPWEYELDGTYEPYAGAGYEIGRVHRNGRS